MITQKISIIKDFVWHNENVFAIVHDSILSPFISSVFYVVTQEADIAASGITVTLGRSEVKYKTLYLWKKGIMFLLLPITQCLYSTFSILLLCLRLWIFCIRFTKNPWEFWWNSWIVRVSICCRQCSYLSSFMFGCLLFCQEWSLVFVCIVSNM